MKVSDLVTLIKTGTLNQTAISEADVLKFINRGLDVLSSEFNLWIYTEDITLSEGITEYALSEKLIQLISAKTEGIYYKNDSGVVEPITDDYFEVPINVTDNYNAVIQTNWNTLNVPYPVDGQVITITYKSAFKELTTCDCELQISPQYLEPLILYVTYLGFMQNGGGSATDSNLYLSRYSNAVQVLKNNGNNVVLHTEDNKFYKRGFV